MKGTTMTTRITPAPSLRQSALARWRVVDIVTASVIGVAAGVIFWGWGLLWNVASIPLAFLPGLAGLLGGGWLFAGVLGAIIVRKAGAALFTEILAAVVSMLIGTQWGWSTLLSGVVQGLGAEIVFALFFYANWRFGVALLGSVGAAAGLVATDLIVSYPATDALFKIVYASTSIVSGVVIAGMGSWAIMRGLARSGALSRFAAGREVTASV
jgi:energy-coupling factor transport system substrate-specific component